MSETKNGVFINGKEQIVELLKVLPREENPELTDELFNLSNTVEDLCQLSELQVKQICLQLPAPIMGLSLKAYDEDTQRHLLSHMPREYAEEVFENIFTKFQNEKQLIQRSKQKLREICAKTIKTESLYSQ
jgi:hypothetical protein